MNSLEARVAIRAGTEIAGVGRGEESTRISAGLQTLGAAAGEQPLDGLSSQASSGFSASYW